MRFRFQFRRYRRPFRAAVRTAHGLWTEREGLWVRVEVIAEGAGGVGYGEAAPIPWFGTETVDEDEAAARELGEWGEGDLLARVPARCGCLRHAIATALAEANGRAGGESEWKVTTLGVAALLPAGPAALGLIGPRAEIGYRVFKWKVGVADIADELALLDDVCAALPPGGRLRLDANGAWDRRKAERWLERCADRPVEFVEQPCFAGAGATEREARKVDEVLLGLAGDFPTPLALDESVVSGGEVERWLGAGWAGIFVLKPSLLADPDAVVARLAKARADVVFSSALETAVGVRAALRTAFGWVNGPGRSDWPPRALGFGVWPLFADLSCDGGAAVPFLRWQDGRRIDAEALWNAAS